MKESCNVVINCDLNNSFVLFGVVAGGKGSREKGEGGKGGWGLCPKAVACAKDLYKYIGLCLC